MGKMKPRTGIPLPSGHLMDGLAQHRERLGVNLLEHRNKHVIPSTSVLDGLNQDRNNLTRGLVQERQQAFTGRKVFNSKDGRR